MLLETGVPQVSDERMHTRVGVRDFRVARFLLFDDDRIALRHGGHRHRHHGADRGRESPGRAGSGLLATVLQASPDIITLLDRNGRVATGERGRPTGCWGGTTGT